ncbi:MAG: transglycosylase domain-containing protein [Clostridia bacterium]
MKKHSIIFSIFKTVCLLFTFVAIFLAIVGSVIAIGIYNEKLTLNLDVFIPSIKAAHEEGFDISTVGETNIATVYDANSNAIVSVFKDEIIYKNDATKHVINRTREYLKLDDMPNAKYIKYAFVDTEDKRFYTHQGYDIKRICKAILSMFKHNGDIVEGASTISQQVVRILTSYNEVSFNRKFVEIGRAEYLEDNFSKDLILETYINYSPFSNATGFYSASKANFAITPDKLNLAQIATLAAMVNSPGKFNYKNGEKAYNLLNQRKELVLKNMLTQGHISEKEYNEAIAFKIVFKESNTNMAKNQYISLAMKQATALVEKSFNCDSAKAKELLRHGDTKIYTNYNPALQEKCFNLLSNYFADKKLQVAFVLTTKDGRIVAAIGSLDSQNIVDRVDTTIRQPGSCFKPLAAYAPAFDLGILDLNYQIMDSYSVSIPNWPKNAGYSATNEMIDVKDAINISYNTCAVHVLESVGINNAMKYLKKFGFTTLTKNDYVIPLALGGISGITPLEITRAYNTFNNNGKKIEISCVKKIVVNGVTIVPDKTKTYVISEDANDMILESLNYVAQNHAKSASVSGHKTYAKTGTTDNVKDLWLCGFTNEVSAALWVGYDDYTPIRNIKSKDVQRLWAKLVNLYY